MRTTADKIATQRAEEQYRSMHHLDAPTPSRARMRPDHLPLRPDESMYAPMSEVIIFCSAG